MTRVHRELFASAVFGLIASQGAASADRGAGLQDLDVLVTIDTDGTGSYEAYIEVNSVVPLSEVRLQSPGEPTVVFDSFDPGSFELELDSDASLIDFLTADSTGETFDLQFVLSTGVVSVYRFVISDVFGPQIDTATLPGVATDLSVQTGTPDVVAWNPPAQLGDALVVRGARPEPFGGEETVYLELSPLPLPAPLLIAAQITPTLDLQDTSVDLPAGLLDEDLILEVNYASVLGLFDPALVSGPQLAIGNAGGLYLASTQRLIKGSTGCAADFNGDGGVNFFDVSGFIAAFNANDPGTDITGDGNLNFFDVSAFLLLFNAGCP